MEVRNGKRIAWCLLLACALGTQLLGCRDAAVPGEEKTPIAITPAHTAAATPSPSPAYTASPAPALDVSTEPAYRELAEKLRALEQPHTPMMEGGKKRYVSYPGRYDATLIGSGHIETRGRMHYEQILALEDAFASQITDRTWGAAKTGGFRLEEVMEPFHLRYRKSGKEAKPVVWEEGYLEIQRAEYMESRVVVLTVDYDDGLGSTPNEMLHLFFVREEETGEYGFAAMQHGLYATSKIPAENDRLIAAGGALYYTCHCAMENDHPYYHRLISVLPLQNGTPRFFISEDWHVQPPYDHLIRGYYAIDCEPPAMLEDGRVRIKLQCTIQYTHDDPSAARSLYRFCEDNLRFQFSLYLYDDLDGKGFYSYDPDLSAFFSPIYARYPYVREGLKEKLIAIAQSAVDEPFRGAAEAVLNEEYGFYFGEIQLPAQILAE